MFEGGRILHSFEIRLGWIVWDGMEHRKKWIRSTVETWKETLASLDNYSIRNSLPEQVGWTFMEGTDGT